MRYFGWLAFLVAIMLVGFAIQNSALPHVTVKLLAWQVETSPVYVMLYSLILGVLITIMLWIPYAVQKYFQQRGLKRQIETLKQQLAEKIHIESIHEDAGDDSPSQLAERVYDINSRRNE
jgi:uncharacterized integral membrane protein